ncbi:DUF7700 domain-containing protein [Novosphingobium guangzhouense]|uniref:DUF7700 domain-containing protein n=1 Tax=Novosphingobium guangzhouense TaxID=1850347 RepID=A0A2K2FVT1_9SPHN|nr:hypothetical protein [Novosphingobium guangzhouense]PNU02896.1 hypothetical protein A8V01_07500 [Novosphingobium guangzhouense]
MTINVATRPAANRTVETIRGQHHKFMLIPMIERHARWFDAGPVSIAVEARALGDSPRRMVRGPSIHVFNATRNEEYLRFDVFGKVLHYHYILNAAGHNVLWGYDPGANGPMIPWVVAALQDRLPIMLRAAGAGGLADEVEQQGWDVSVLPLVAREATMALAPRDDDMERAREGMDWMHEWKRIHPQFNTVEEGEY